eukprot:g40216.t1
MGTDNIPVIVLNTCAPELAAPLAKLFQCSYNTGIYPAMWKIAQVCPVHTKQDKSNLANYCPISLLSIISKARSRSIHPLVYPRLRSVSMTLLDAPVYLLELQTTYTDSWARPEAASYPGNGRDVLACRGPSTLHRCDIIMKDTNCSNSCPYFGKSNHKTVHLFLDYKQKLKHEDLGHKVVYFNWIDKFADDTTIVTEYRKKIDSL